MYNRDKFVDEMGLDLKGITDKAFKKLAKDYPEHFSYFDHAIYNPDITVAYGYAADNGRFWRIPDSVEVYNNVFDPICAALSCYSLREVYIGTGLKEFENISACFAMDLEKIHVDPENPYFSSHDGCLYSKDKKEFLYFPATLRTEEGKFEIRPGTKIIKAGSFTVFLLPNELVIPKSVTKIEPNWLWETYDKGFDMSREEICAQTKIICPKHLEGDLEATWAKYPYGRPTIIYI